MLTHRIPLVAGAIVAALAAASPAASSDDIPPMILARQPSRIAPISGGYYVTYDTGKSERWLRTSDGYYADSGRFTRTSNGYFGNGERYQRTSDGWRATTGSQSTRIHATTSGYRSDGSLFFRTSNGYFRSDTSAVAAGLAFEAPSRMIIRMKTSMPSSFRRWSDRTSAPIK